MADFRGSCLCGGVAYSIKGPLQSFFLCHCSRCRKASGAAYGANIFSKEAAIAWDKGSDKIKTYHLDGSRFCTTFCVDCGSKVPTLMASGTLMVPAGSLDSTFELKPKAHIFMQDRAHWEDDLDSAEKFQGYPE